jgi:hypothetical protein
VRLWARKESTVTEEREGLRTYQGLEGGEASSVAKSLKSRWLDTVGIPHQSFAGGRIDPVEDECVDLRQTENNGDVREVRQGVGSVGVGTRGSGVVGVRRNRRFLQRYWRGSCEKFEQPGGMIWRGKKGEGRGECGLYIGTGWGETAGV